METDRGAQLIVAFSSLEKINWIIFVSILN